MAKSDNPNVQNYLSDVDFPARKNQILNAARNKKAPQDVMNQLQNMPDQEFQRADDVQDVLRQRTQGQSPQTGQQGQGQQGGQQRQGQGQTQGQGQGQRSGQKQGQGQRSGRGREEEE